MSLGKIGQKASDQEEGPECGKENNYVKPGLTWHKYLRLGEHNKFRIKIGQNFLVLFDPDRQKWEVA